MSSRRFQREGWSRQGVRDALAEFRTQDFDWKNPRNFKASYFAGDGVVQIADDAFNQYMGDNVIYGHSLFPSLPQLESEVVDMVLEMVHAPADGYGSVTTGGTESIVLAVKTARDWARETKPHIEHPEIILPETSHPAFSRAAHLLGITVKRMSTSPDYRADVAGMVDAITENTIMIVGSAPPYPFGLVDPIGALGEAADAHGLWMHIDACIGGFILPFAEELGYPVPAFDFRVPAVTSMSVDLHKYGYANRGSSCLLVRDKGLENFQRFSFGDWPAGTYSTLGFAGSRNGGPVASAWSVMRYLGYEGYLSRVEKILIAKHQFMAGIDAMDELMVFGQPEGGHLTFGASEDLNMFAVARGMQERGWWFAQLQRPPAMLILLNYTHGDVVDAFLSDLGDVVVEVRSGRLEASDESARYVV